MMKTTQERYTVHGQSTPCPDGYDRTIYFVWDHEANQIVATHTIKKVCEEKKEKLVKYG